MKYIKFFESNSEINPYFPEVLKCVINSYEDMMYEFYDWFNQYGNDLDEWSEMIFSCLNDDDKKDFGNLFIKNYIIGDKTIELVRYLCNHLKLSPIF